MRLGPRVFLPLLALLLVSILACRDGGGASPGVHPGSPDATPAAQGATPLTPADRMLVDEFAQQRDAVADEWDQLYEEFDEWRAGLAPCEPSAAHRALRGFAGDFNGVTEQVRDIPRTVPTGELADILITAAEEEAAAFRQLRDRWQPGNVSLFELVERRRSGAADAQKTVEDLALNLQDDLEQGPTTEDIEEVEAFGEALEPVKEAWDRLHDAYAALGREAGSLDGDALIGRLEQLIEQSEGIVAMLAALPYTGATEEMIDTLQDSAGAELLALLDLADALTALTAEPPSPPEGQDPAPPALPEGEDEAPEVPATPAPPPAPPPPPDLAELLAPLLGDVDAAFTASQEALAELEESIEEISQDHSMEYLAHLEEFRGYYEELVVAWDAFHQDYNDWRNGEGGCDRDGVLRELGRFNQWAGDLGRRVRDLPQSRYLRPMHSLLVEAAEREEAALRALLGSWRPFAVDPFKAVDLERVNSDRLRRQADIGLQELRARE